MTNVAMAGCADERHEWTLWWGILTAVHFWSALVLLAAPTNIAPYMGKWKYLNLHPFAWMKDATEREWDPVTVSAAHGSAVNLFSIGLFALWAIDSDEHFSFASVIVASEGVAMLSWMYSYMRFRDLWKWTIFVPLNVHVIMFVLALVLVGDYDTDSKQLQPGGDHTDSGVVLWTLFGVRFFQCAMWMYRAIVKKSDSFFLKKGLHYESRFATAILVHRAATSLHITLMLFWAALYYDGGHSDFQFPLAFWTGLVAAYLPWMWLFCSQEEMWWPHFMVGCCTVYTALASITIALWYADCHETN
eukprot:m.75528 g.75528  ORF g.75528 m.75528 type:complete len:303 (+) comp18969_c0_seq2:220-1128(+)